MSEDVSGGSIDGPHVLVESTKEEGEGDQEQGHEIPVEVIESPIRECLRFALTARTARQLRKACDNR